MDFEIQSITLSNVLGVLDNLNELDENENITFSYKEKFYLGG